MGGDRIDWMKLGGAARPTDSPGFLLWRIGGLWQRQMKTALKPHRLTHTQFVLLACLAWLSDHSEGPVTQVALANQTGLDKVMTGEVLASLEEMGLVKRRPHQRDKRAMALEATAAGRQRLRKALPDVVEVDRTFFRPLVDDGYPFLLLMQRLDNAARQPKT